MNIFHHTNKVFFLYGLESDINGKFIQRFLFTITTLTLIIDAIFWITLYFLHSRELFLMSWVIKMVVRFTSYSLYISRHKRLIQFTKQIKDDIMDKNMSRVSLVLLMIWCASMMCMLPSIIRWTRDSTKRDDLSIHSESLNLALFLINNILGVIYGFGIGIMQLLVYFQTHYIIYRIKVNHYQNLSKKSEYRDYHRIRNLRIDEIRIRELEQNFNELIGYVPSLWMAELFIRLCIGITHFVVSKVNYEEVVLYFFDTIIFHSILLVIIIFVGYFDNKYDTNSVIAVVNKALPPKPSHDLSYELEMIKYLAELSSRAQTPIRSLGLFSINGVFILVSANAVISFSVMFIQLMQGMPNLDKVQHN